MSEREPPPGGAHNLLLVASVAAGLLGVTMVSAGLLPSPTTTHAEPAAPAWQSSPELLPVRRELSHAGPHSDGLDPRAGSVVSGRNGPNHGRDLRRELTELAQLQRRQVREPIPGHYATPDPASAGVVDWNLATPVNSQAIRPLPLDTITPSRPR